MVRLVLGHIDIPLIMLHLENETEVSLFNRELYDQFKLNPEVHVRYKYAGISMAYKWMSRLAGTFKILSYPVRL